MGEREWAPSDVFDVSGDTYARRILVLASDRPLSADGLAEQLSVSRPTICRRLNTLVDYDLLRNRQQIDVEGNHYQLFETTLKRITFGIDGGDYNIDLTMRQSLADQFESFWTDLEGANTDPTQNAESHPDRGPMES